MDSHDYSPPTQEELVDRIITNNLVDSDLPPPKMHADLDQNRQRVIDTFCQQHTALRRPPHRR